MNLFNKALIFLPIFVIAFLTPSFAQEAQWMVEPFIGKPKDLINIYEQHEIIHFEREGKEGVVNFKNEVILPARYDKIEIYETSKYINAKIGRDEFHYDFEGYELEESMKQTAKEAEWAKTNQLNSEKANKFNSEVVNFKVVEVGIQSKHYKAQLMGYALLNQVGDTLVFRSENLDNFMLVEEDFIVHQGEGVHSCTMFNAKGDTIIHDKSYRAEVELKNDWIKVKGERKEKLYDKDMNLIVDEHDYIYPHKTGNAFSYREGKNTFLLDAKGKAVSEIGYTTIRQIKDSEFLLLKKSGESAVYNTNTATLVNLKYPLHKPLDGSLIQIVKLEDKFGVINIQSNELVVPFEYENIRIKKGLALAKNVVEKNGEDELSDYKVFNESGEMVYQANAYKMYLHDSYVLVAKDEEGKSRIMGKDGKLLLEPKKGQSFHLTTGPWVYMKSEKGSIHYTISSVLKGEPSGYLSGGRLLKGSEDGEFPNLYIAGKGYKKQIGAIDEEGNVVIPMAYPEIKVTKLCGQKYLTSRSRPYGPIGIIQKWH